MSLAPPQSPTGGVLALRLGALSSLVRSTGSVALPLTSPSQAFPLGRANNSEENAVIKTPTKRRSLVGTVAKFQNI